MYQPALGRFLQPDPKGFGAGDYNLYRDCHNDPVNKADPDGLVDLSYTPIGPDFDDGGGLDHRKLQRAHQPIAICVIKALGVFA